MKKFILCLLPIVLSACSTPKQQSTVPMDMKAVQEYQQKVASGKTVDLNNKKEDEPLNQSDRKQKVIYQTIPQPVFYPRVGFGYHHGWDW